MSLRVLHVDDEPSFGQLVADFLEREDERMEVRTETTAEDGLRRLDSESDSIDCIVSDYDMPGRDGIEFLEAVRERRPDLPFILFTGKGSEEVASEAMSAGATDYLQKQSGTEQYELLANRVRNAVEQHRSSERAENLARLRRLAADVNHELVHAETRSEVERRVCRTIVETDPYEFALIGDVDVATERLEPRAAAVAGDGHLEAGTATLETDHGPGVAAVQNRTVAVSQDIAEDITFGPGRDEAVPRDLRSAAAVPLEYSEELYGVLVVYATRPDAFDERERELLDELAGDVVHAVHAREIREDLERFRSLLDRTTDAILMLDPDTGEFLEVNDRACTRLGYTRDELLDRSILDIQGTLEELRDYRDLVERAREEESLLIEGVHEAKDGSTYPVEVRMDYTWIDGRAHVVAIARDITEQRRRQQRLERQRDAMLDLTTDDAVIEGDLEAAAERITETAADVLDLPRVNIWLFDDDRTTLECLDNYDRSTGRHERGTVLHADEYPNYFTALRNNRVIAAEHAQSNPHTNELAEEYLEPLDVESLLDATLRAGGDVVGVVCHESVGEPREWTEDEIEFAGDIAEAIHRALRNRETKEREQELELRTRAMNEAPVGITITDPDRADNPIVYANDEFLEVSGYSSADVLGENHRFLQGPDTREEPVAEMRAAIDDDDPVTVELRNYRNDGELFWNRVRIAPVRDDAGAVTNYVGFQEEITERKRRERELRRSKRRFDSVFEDPHILVGLLDSDGAVLDVNDTAMEYVDADPEDVVDRPFWETPWWPEGMRSEIRDTVERAAAGEYVEYEADLTKPDETSYSVTGVVRPVTDDAGDVASLIVSARDITDQVVRQRQLDAVLENTSDPVFMKNRDGEYVLVNRGWRELFGFEAETVRGLTDEELFPAEMAAEVRTNDERVLETGDPIETEERIIVDGEERTFLSSKTPVYDIGAESDPDEPVAVFGVAKDITELKRREAELTRIREQIEFALTRTDSVIWHRDLDTDEITTYPDPCPVLGNSAGTVGEFNETVHPDDRGDVEDAVTAAIDTKESTSVEYRTTDEFDPEWVQTMIEPMLDDDGSVSELIGITRDISERKRREQTLERQNERFDELASAVSHDLQTPLSTARGRTELAIETGDAEQMEKALHALERADELRENLVEVLRSREVVGETEPVDVGEAAEDVWETITATAEASLHLVDPPNVNGDPGAVRRLFENLLSNAVEHGGDDVSVHVGRVDGGFYVEDDGDGIPEHQREEVFTPGYSTKESGSGIGMASVREIVLAHDWTISVTDGERGGARFEVRTE